MFQIIRQKHKSLLRVENLPINLSEFLEGFQKIKKKKTKLIKIQTRKIQRKIFKKILKEKPRKKKFG